MHDTSRNDSPPSAVEKGRGTLWLVWLIPLVAFAMAGWMVYKYYAEKGVDIVITFDSGAGFEVGKTPLLYKGIKIGTVTDVQIDKDDLRRVNVTVTVDRRAVDATARRGNEFVRVSPKVSLTEITGLDTIISGVYIEAYAGKKTRQELLSQPKQFHFTGKEKPTIKRFDGGLYVTLTSSDGSLSVGTPVLHKKFIVGEVTDRELTAQGVRYLVHINKPYVGLVKAQSRFWRISGMELRASLAGIKVSFDSLATMLVGGIAFDTPKNGTPVTGNQITKPLFPDVESVRLSEETIALTSKEAYNLEPGLSHVYFQGNIAGKVTDVTFLPDTESTRITIRLDKRFRHLANRKAHFWIVQPQLSLEGIKGLDAIARGPYIAFSTAVKNAPQQSEFVLERKPMPPKGKHVTLRIDEAKGVGEGTPIFFSGIKVGVVTKVAFTPEKESLEADAVIRDEYVRYLNDSSCFYVRSGMEVQMGVTGLYVNSGSLEEIVAGGIAFETADTTAKRQKRSYRLFKSYKAMRKYRYLEGGGMMVTLALKQMGSLSVGDPVLYKQNKAGEIVSVAYDEAADRFLLDVFVAKPYSNRINTSTRFTEASGIELTMALPTISLKAGSLETILRGGLSFETPDAHAAALPKHAVLALHDRASDYDTFTLRMPRGGGLHPGSALRYRGVPIGEVKTLSLVPEGVEAAMLIKKRYSDLLDQDSWFWLETFTADLEGVKHPSAAISGPSIALLPGRSGIRETHFALRDTPPPPTYAKTGLRIVLEGDRRSSLDVGSPLYYRQVPIGKVESWTLSNDGRTVDFVCFIAPKYAHLVRENARFYNATAFGMDVSLFGVKVQTETLKTMLAGGIGMAVPDEAGSLAKPHQRFKLQDAPKEAWLEWQPSL